MSNAQTDGYIWFQLQNMNDFKYFEIDVFSLLLEFMMNLNAPSKTWYRKKKLFLFLAHVLQNLLSHVMPTFF